MAKRYERVIKAVTGRWTDNAMAKRYQRGNQNGKSKMDRQYNGQKKKDKQRSTKHNTEN